MRAISEGDAAAFRAFYDRHSPTVYALCVRMLKNPGDAEQLLTDVFFEIWSSRDRYDATRSNPLTYLMRMTRSRAIDKLRRKGPVGSIGGISLDSLPPELMCPSKITRMLPPRPPKTAL